MFYVKLSESTTARRRVPILMVDETDGTTPLTGLTLSGLISKNGGTFAGVAGSFAEAGYGQYYYQFTTGEIDTLGWAGIHVTATGARNYDAIIHVTSYDAYTGGFITAGSVWTEDISAVSGAGLAGTQLNLAAAGGGAGITAGDVWSYVLSDTNTAEANLITAASGAGITAGDVWEYDISAISTAGSAGTQLNVAAAGGGAGITAGAVADAVWTAQVATYATAGSNETLGTDTYGQKIARTVNINRPISINTANAVVVGSMSNGAITATAIASNAITEAKFGTDAISSRVIATDAITSAELAPSANTEIADAVWATVARTITGGTITTVSDKTGYSLSGTQSFNLTGNITGNLSGSVGSVTSGVTVTTNNDKSDYNVGTIDNGAITAATFQNGAIDAAALAGDAVSEIATGVWGAATKTITGGTIDTNNDKTGYSLTGTQAFNLTGDITGNLSGSVGSVSGNVSGSVGSVTGSVDSVVTDVNVSTTSMSGIANTVWNYVTRTLTSGAGLTAGDVWTYAGGRTITGGIVTSVGDKTGYSLSGTQAFNLTGNITGSVSGSVGSVTGSVGSVVNAVTISTGSMSGIANTVWGYVSRTLTSATGITAGDVWSYAGGRTITGGTATTVTNAVLVDPASMVGIAGTVWSTDISSYPNPSAGYSLAVAGSGGVSAADVWQYGSRGLTDAVNVSTTSMSGIANTVWSNASRTITGGAVTTVVDPVNVSTTSMSGIAGTVWTYTPRTITSGAGATAGDVWTYNISGIATTGTAGAVLNDAAVAATVISIVNGPYRLTSIAEGTDGRIDILADSVQTIQLNCLDGFGQPFNITGYSCSVNVYDISGALAVTYTPTVDFASSGILSFDIDTDVTGVTSTYTLVVELTAGAEVVQLGPLQILVRPL